MDDRLSPACYATLQILVVPVQPIKRAVFDQYASIISSFTRIALRDVPPDTRTMAQSQCSAAPYSNGLLMLRYCDSYSRSQLALDDLEYSRRIFGIIGIMDCREWPEEEGGLADGLQEFNHSLRAHPPPLATRCFAFNLGNDQREVQGTCLVSVPNVGDIHFYLGTLMADFCASILHEMTNILNGLDAKPAPTPSLPRSTSLNATSNLHSLAADDGNLRTVSTPIDQSSAISHRSFPKRSSGRLAKLRGDVKALAGRWDEAQAAYSEAIALCRNQFDDLFLASTIESSAALTVLQAWQAISGGSVPVLSSTKVELTSLTAPTSSSEPIKDLTANLRDIPDRYSQVLALYSKNLPESSHHDAMPFGEPTPILAYAESCLRAARFLLCVHFSGGWNASALMALVSTDFPSKQLPSSPIQRSLISEFVSLMFVTPLDGVPLPDRLSLLGSAAAIYRAIGYERKRAGVIREIASCIADGVRSARAEHQKQSGSKDVIKSMPLNEGNQAVLTMLEDITAVYGLEVSPQAVYNLAETQDLPTIQASAEKDHFGWPTLQTSLLRDGAMALEFLASYSAALRFLQTLTRKLGDFVIQEEQSKAANELSVLVGAANRRSTVQVGLDWWGPEAFLVSMELLPPEPGRALYLSSTAGVGKQGPFLYNPSKTAGRHSMPVFPAKDQLVVAITLRNTLAIPLQVNDLALVTTGPDCEVVGTTVVISPASLMSIKLVAVPQGVGVLRFTGVRARLFNSISRQFAAVEETDHGLNIIDRSSKFSGMASRRFSSQQTVTSTEIPSLPRYIEAEIVAQLPYLRLLSTNLRCGALSLLAGESIPLLVSVENASQLPVTSLTINCHDNLTHHAITALSDSENEMPPGIAFEIDHDVRSKPVFAYALPPIHIKPGRQRQLIIDCYGKRDCTEGVVLIDYTLTKTESDAVQYFRRLAVPLSLSVDPGLFADGLVVAEFSATRASRLDQDQKGTFNPATHCLLLLSISNTLATAFNVDVVISRDDEQQEASSRIDGDSTKNVLFGIKRFRLPVEVVQQPIPGPQAVARQFVLTDARKAMTAREVAKERELFWYRHELLSSLSVKWREQEAGRHGDLALRHLRLTQPMLDVIKLSPLSIDLEFAEIEKLEEQEVDWHAQNGVFYQANVMVQNFEDDWQDLLLILSFGANDARVQDCLIDGSSHVRVRRLKTQESFTHAFSFCPLSDGLLPVCVSIADSDGLLISERDYTIQVSCHV